MRCNELVTIYRCMVLFRFQIKELKEEFIILIQNNEQGFELHLMQCDDDMQTCFLTFIVLAVLDCSQPSDTFKKMFLVFLFNKEYIFFVQWTWRHKALHCIMNQLRHIMLYSYSIYTLTC